MSGVLFGKKEPDSVHIHTFRPVECQHKNGPGFELSAKDLERLDRRLAESSTDGSLKELVPVGWYRSSSHRELLLTEKDIALYNRSFRNSWQIAMVLKRSKKEPVRIGFFLREQNGAALASTPYKFVIQDLRKLAPKAETHNAEAISSLSEVVSTADVVALSASEPVVACEPNPYWHPRAPQNLSRSRDGRVTAGLLTCIRLYY